MDHMDALVMRRISALAILLFAALQLLIVAGAAAAKAIPQCSAEHPAALTYDKDASRGLDKNGRVNVKHGETSIQKVTYAFTVGGCNAGSLGLIDPTFPELRDPDAAKVVLVAKDSDKMSLEIDFKNANIDPGLYQLTAVSSSKAAPLVYPVDVVVQDTALWKVALAMLGAGMAGAFVLAARAYKSSESAAKFWDYFRQQAGVLAVVWGIAGMAAATATIVLKGDDWFGHFDQLWPMLLAQFSAMIAVPTTVTSVSGSAAKIQPATAL